VSAATRLPALGKQYQAARSIRVEYLYLEPLKVLGYFNMVYKQADGHSFWRPYPRRRGRLDPFNFLYASQTPDPSAKFDPDPQNCNNSCRR
jgi:hypothetical protein